MTTPSPSAIASGHVRAELARRNLTRAELAEMLGVQDMWLARRLKDQVPLSIDDLVRIARALDVPLATLIDLKAAS